MQENTNKAIAINSIILYVRMVITAVCAILTTRYALIALGVSDFGLFSLLGGIISFVLIFNTIMLSTTNRFIAVALGKGDIKEANEQFNVNLVIHIFLAIITLGIAIPVGDWYISNYVNYDGAIDTAIWVYRISICGSVLSFIGVPYNGLLMAKEKFLVFCSTDVISHVLKLIVAYLLMFYFDNKLQIYTITQAILTAYPTYVFAHYCYQHYKDITHFIFVRDVKKYLSVFSFSGWVAYGAVATVGKNQGAAILVNVFFNTVMNTALGVANNINAYLQMFAQNIANPIAPQLTKSYAAGDMERCNKLLVLSTKLSFLVMLIISTPFLVEPDWLLTLWLGESPEFASQFLILLIIDALASSLYLGVSNVVFASGKIAIYQLSANTLRLLSVAFAYMILKAGGEAYSLIYAYILFTVIIFFVGQMVLKYILNFNIKELCVRSYLPSVLVATISLPVFIFSLKLHPLMNMSLAFCYVSIVTLFVGFNREERSYFYKSIQKFLKR